MEMETRIRELEIQYSKLPKEIKEIKRWVCYRKSDKAPMNAITGNFAQSNNPFTWTTFRNAIIGCAKYNFDGLGFMLGNGVFGVDLDNHVKSDGTLEVSKEDFDALSSEFITSLNSYSERSQSGKGIHIICKGKLPEGARRKGNVEMYDSGRYFAMTGNVVNDEIIQERQDEIAILWKKYLYTEVVVPEKTVKRADGSVSFSSRFECEDASEPRSAALSLSDNEVINRIKASRSAEDFMKFYVRGRIDFADTGEEDHSRADLCLCTLLAFWCGKDTSQMDRLFRSSALMRDKWDEQRGAYTYGERTIMQACNKVIEVYNPPKEKTYAKDFVSAPVVQANNITIQNNKVTSSINENGDPVLNNVKKTFKSYSLDDTGNAERFYDYFGDIFRYNSDNKSYMYWDNTTWVKDTKEYAKKYTDEMIKILKAEAVAYEKSINELSQDGTTPESKIKEMTATYKGMVDNIKKLSNKAGKESMLAELQHLHNMPISNSDFDKEPNLINTESGIVNLDTGEVMPFDPKKYMSKNTKCEVSYEEPTTWLKFLHDIFERGSEEETQEIIDTVQMALGYSATGRTNKEHLFILFGNGSNGKSTFIDAVNTIFGDYGQTMNSSLLIQNPNASSQSTEFSMSALLGARMVSTSETKEGGKLDDVTIKQMTSGEKINAQFKYGAPFSFRPTFSTWMSTNNKPIIRATDFGVWRRVFFVPFLNTFSGEKKDVNMPAKLAAEYPKILGWIIKGNIKLHNEYQDKLPKPKCLEEALADYKNEMDVLNAFFQDRCVDFPSYKTRACDLYQEYTMWAKTNNDYLMPERKFGIEMAKKKYEKIRCRDGNYYIGIKLAKDHKGHIFEENEDD